MISAAINAPGRRRVGFALDTAAAGAGCVTFVCRNFSGVSGLPNSSVYTLMMWTPT